MVIKQPTDNSIINANRIEKRTNLISASPLVLFRWLLLNLLLNWVCTDGSMNLLEHLLNVIWLNSLLNIFTEVRLVLLWLIFYQSLESTQQKGWVIKMTSSEKENHYFRNHIYICNTGKRQNFSLTPIYALTWPP